MEAIKEYLRLHCGVVWAPLTYVIQKTITVQTYGDYPTYATPDDEMIARILHLPLEKNMLLHETDTQVGQACMTEYKIDNRTIYDILDHIYKDTGLYPYVKQHKSKRDERGAFMPSTPGGWSQTMLMQQHQKLIWLCR